jgi:putative hydrolases of HD superfamily
MTPDATGPVIADEVGPPSGTPERLAAQVRFLIEIDQLKTVLRRNTLLAADRRENDAEHSWHLAMMVLLLSEYADEPVDAARTLGMVLIHDLVEVYAGDSFVYDPAELVGQADRERVAADRLFALLPADQATGLRGLWDEFEGRLTPEARFANALDRLQPLMLNYHGRGGTWSIPGVTDDAVRARATAIGDASGGLSAYALALIDQAIENGWLARTPGSTSG